MKPRFLEDLMEEAGYKGLSDFMARSEVAVSKELVRRAMHGEYTTWGLYVILVALRLPTDRIRSILEETGDTLLAPRLGGVVLTPPLDVYLHSLEAIIRKRPDLTMHVSIMLETLGRAADIDLTASLRKAAGM